MGSIARRSSGSWTVTVKARQGGIRAASSRARAGHGAIYELARIIDSFRRELREDKLTFNVGLIGGGDSAMLDKDRIRAVGHRQDQHHRRPRPSRGAICAPSTRRRSTARGRRCARSSRTPLPGAKATHRDSTRTAIRRWRRPRQRRAAGQAQRGQRRPRPAGDGGARPAQARRRRHQLRRARRRGGINGLGPASRGDHAPGRSGRHRLASGARPSAPRS